MRVDVIFLLIVVEKVKVEWSQIDDVNLADQAAMGAPGAWEEIIDRYGSMISRLIYRWGLTSDRDDLIQEIFIRAWKRLDTFRAEASLGTWIYQIAINHLRNHKSRVLPRRRREVRQSDFPLNEEGEETARLDALASTPADQEDSLNSSEVLAIVRTCLADLSYDFREALVLRDLDDLSYAEIAERLGVSEGTVKSRIFRGRRALAEVLIRKGVIR